MDKQQKCWLIELLAYWEGGVNTAFLRKYTGHSRVHDQQAITDYKDQAPNNLKYCPSKKMHLPHEPFKKHYISGEVDEYLNWLQDPNRIPIFAESGHKKTSHESMVYPARDINPHIVKTLVAAIKQQRYVDVCYKSMKNPDGDRRIIAPHTLVNTGLRWHVRTWCENNNAFRDMVLNRFTSDMKLIEPSDINIKNDKAWNTLVTIKFRADQRLSGAKKSMLENDYKMVNGEFSITTRGCLVDYQLKALQVNPKILDGNPEAQQLVLANLDDLDARDVKLFPDAEMRLNKLTNIVYTKLHKKLFDLGSTSTAVSFPKYKVILGNVIRIHGEASDLVSFQSSEWLGGLSGYCKLSSVLPIPSGTKFRVVRRKQSNMTQSKLSRLLKRGSISKEGAKEYRAKSLLRDWIILT